MDKNENLKFVLYARKSTTDEGSQVHSIEDQIKVCQNYANAHSINIIKIIKEDQSAKYAGNRPRFSQMIKDVKKGVYDGIIAYHPDRISRNMLEAGKVIDMLTPDKNKTEAVLKSLIFPTITYANDSGGRLMLAVLFSMATQYSEHLSEVVSRGINSNLQRGISAGTPKWGYDIDPITQHYKPNKSFSLVQKGFKMILDGETQKEVVDYWNRQGLERFTKITKKNKIRKRKTVSEKTIGNILRDPFYYGVLCQSGQEVDLKNIPNYNFKPIITEEEYNKIQASFSNNSKKSSKLTGKRSFLPLRRIVHCAECGKLMYPNAAKGTKGYYGYLSCQNKNCKRERKNVRMKVVLDGIYDFLDRLKLEESAYEEYIKQVDNFINEELDVLKKDKRSKNGARNQIKSEIGKLSADYAGIVSDKDTPKAVIDNMRVLIKEKENAIKELDKEIKEIDSILNNTELIKLNKKDFSNLIKSAKQLIRNGNLVQKDQIIKMLFSNIEIDNKNKLTCILKEEFDGLISVEKINSGAPD